MHPSGKRKIPVDLPWRQENVKRVAQERYTSLATSVANSERTADIVIIEIAVKIKQENVP